MSESVDPCIHLIQLLCPRRHCVVGCAYEPARQTHEEVVSVLEAKRTLLQLNPWCGICGSRELAYEDRPTPFRSMEDALPALRETERANLESRAHLEKLGLTYDSQSQN